MAPCVRLRLWNFAVVALSLALGARSASAGKISAHTAASPSLGRPLNYVLYEPTAAPASGRWPVLYLLHGLGDSSRAWRKYGHVRATMDRLIDLQIIPPMLVVMPGAGRSWYVDNPDPGGSGMMEEAITKDLVHAIDSNHPTLACRGGRLIGGLSMGGYGATLYALDRPRLYAAAFSMSGGFWKIAPTDERPEPPSWNRFNVAFGRPLDPTRKNEWSVFSRIRAYAADPDRTPLWLSVGDRDYPRLMASNLELSRKLAAAGAPTPFRIDSGAHNWRMWSKELAPALKWAVKHLKPAC